MLGLYVHVPFCAKICHYCNFVVTASGARAKEEAFLDCFEAEIRHHAPALRKREFDTLYIGGGTPSVLSEGDLARVVGSLRDNFKFKEGIEFTLEANPGDATPEKARFFASLGVNRISLGAQTFQDRTLAAINRRHDAAAIGASFEALRSAGIGNINMDLILSLPGETIDDVKDSVEKLLALEPDHVSLYELVVEEKTVFGKRQKQGKLSLPSEESQIEQLSYARERLKKAGYEHYELLNYAKPGRRSRHNLIYWANREYLGLGPGAFAYVDGRRWRHSASVEEYLRKAKAGDWSALEEETLGPKEREIESFLLALRLADGASTLRFARVVQKMRKTVDSLAEKGLLEEKNGALRLTSRGQFFAETIFSELSSE